MDKVEQLFVRACKSNNPKVRLVSVLRRFYIGNFKTLDRNKAFKPDFFSISLI